MNTVSPALAFLPRGTERPIRIPSWAAFSVVRVKDDVVLGYCSDMDAAERLHEIIGADRCAVRRRSQ